MRKALLSSYVIVYREVKEKLHTLAEKVIFPECLNVSDNAI